MKKICLIPFNNKGKIRMPLLIMKNFILFFFIFIIQANANILSQVKVSLDMENANVKQLIREIESQTDLGFLFSMKEIRNIKGISINEKNISVEEALEMALLNSGLSFELSKNVIILKPTPIATQQTENESTLILQTIEVKGTVVDEKGNPLPGANVFVKETTIGVTTDMDGNYLINVPNEESVLVFSFIGYEPQEIVVGTQSLLNVSLNTAESELEEIIVTGYQDIKKKHMTGSVSTINANTIANKGAINVEDAIKGQLAGVTMLNTSGRPGETAQIRIRGINSLTGSSEPIWIVDGMPLQGDVPSLTVGGVELQNTILTNGLGNITPDDIESITILKDAAASAIYGSRAANGVIVIKTKSGSAGKTYFSSNLSFSLQEKPFNKIDMMSSAQKVDFEKGLYEDFGYQDEHGRVMDIMYDIDRGYLSEEEGGMMIEDLKNINTDWYDELFRQVKSQNYSLSMSGGTEKTQYYVSGNYLNQNGIVPNNKYSRMGINSKLTHNPHEKVRITVNLGASVRKDISSASIINPLKYATFANPYERPYDENGNMDYDQTFVKHKLWDQTIAWPNFNIFHDLNNNTNTSDYLNTSLATMLEYEIIDGLMYTAHFALDYSSTQTITEIYPDTYTSFQESWANNFYWPAIPYDLNNGSLRESSGRTQGYTFRNTFRYSKLFSDKHYINAYLGQEISSRDVNNFYHYSPEYNPDYRIVGYPSNTGGEEIKTSYLASLGGTGVYLDRSSSYFFQGSYTYDDRYVIGGSIRFDGVSIIGNENQFVPLWNVSAKYNIHEEDFIKNFKFINAFSIRGSYGFTGSIDLSANKYLNIQFQDLTWQYQNELVPTSFDFPNPSVKWQTKKDRNLGIDLSVLKSRVNITFNYFNNITNDVLDNRRLPISSGRSSIISNAATIKNEGIEVSLNTVNIRSENITWSTSFNISKIDNTILKTYYDNLEEVPYNLSNTFVKGYPVNSWYGYKFAGIDPETGNVLAYANVLNSETGEREDVIMDMEQARRRGALPDVSYLGNGYPPITGGFGTQLTYKRLSLNALFTFMTGHKIRAFQPAVVNVFQEFNGQITDYELTNSRLNRPVSDLYRWAQPGDITDIQRFDRISNAYNEFFYDSKLEDGSFLKCSYISLGYNLPTDLVQKLKLTRVRINLTGHNLFTFTKYRGADPENMGVFGYPNTRRYAFSINIGI